MEKSIWSEFSEKPKFAKLSCDVDCEVLVIGGGMAGILTAYFLQEQGRDVILVEADKIGNGITKNTTAVLTAQHDEAYGTLIRTHGRKKAKAYLDANLEAVKTFERVAEGIDCDFKRKSSFRYSRDKDLSKEYRALRELGYDRCRLTEDTGLPFEVRSAVEFPDMAEFHPLKFLYGLAGKLKIYEDTFIEEIQYHTAFTNKYRIRFRQAVVATHFPFINRTGWFFLKMFQKRSYVIALENAGEVKGSYIDDVASGFYFRNYGDLLLIGKGDHRTGTPTDAPQELEAFAKKYYPDAIVKCAWANQDCVSLDGMPYVGKYGRIKDVYTLSGFNLWGMTGSMAGARILADTLSGKENPYAAVFRTGRSILHVQLFQNLGVALKNWIRPTVKRCPHLGCALIYNEREHSWDCQCHGSRFEKDGKLIDNPATRDSNV